MVDAAAVDPADRQRVAAELGYSETIFVDSARCRVEPPRTPASSPPPPNCRSPGTPRSGASWWLRTRGHRSTPCRYPRASCRSSYDRDLTDGAAHAPSGRPTSRFYDLATVDELSAADPDDYSDDAEHYLWTWIDEPAGTIRSRMFAADLGFREDEATGAAAVRITDYLSRDLTIMQGKGSIIQTTWSAEGWVKVAGRVADDGARQID